MSPCAEAAEVNSSDAAHAIAGTHRARTPLMRVRNAFAVAKPQRNELIQLLRHPVIAAALRADVGFDGMMTATFAQHGPTGTGSTESQVTVQPDRKRSDHPPLLACGTGIEPATLLPS